MPIDTSSLASNNSSYLDIISDPNNLYNAFLLAKKGSSWKASVQQYEINLLKNITDLSESLKNHTYRQKPFTEFIMCERGKIRPIRAQCVEDRVVQRCLCDNILLPTLRSYLIYDNGASLKGRGIDFSKKRLKVHLEKFLRHHDTGYILLIDFSKFFDNIPHDLLYKAIKEKLNPNDQSIDWLLKHVIESFSNDVSYMTDKEFLEYENDLKPFNSLEHRLRKAEYKGPKGLKVLHKSLAIGSQISQISGIFYPSKIDNYFKCVKGFRYYGRYMDDVYIISENKEELQDALKEFINQAKKLRLFVNLKKTQIIKLTDWFTYLKVRTRVVGKKIVQRLHHSIFIRERRRLFKLKKRLDQGKIAFPLIYNSYLSWRGVVRRKKNCRLNVFFTDHLFISLFIKNKSFKIKSKK